MKLLKLTVLSFFLALTLTGLSHAQKIILLGAVADVCGDDAGEGTLYNINPETAVSNPIGSTGFNGLTGLEFLPDGRLVGSANDDADGNKIAILIEINQFTGQGSLIGEIGNDTDNMSCGRAPGMTYDPATNTLYATGKQCESSNDSFQSINTSTGRGTIIGQTGFNGGGNGLAKSADGTFFSFAGPRFITINQDTGQGTETGVLLPPRRRISALDFHPVTGVLYGILRLRADSELVTIDTETGALTVIGSLPDCSDGLVFGRIMPSPIPTLSEWGLIAMAAIFGIIGLLTLKKRKFTA